jgi:hypothetical protein
MFSQGQLEGPQHSCQIISLLINKQLYVSLSLDSSSLALMMYVKRQWHKRHDCLYYPTCVYNIKIKKIEGYYFKIFYYKICTSSYNKNFKEKEEKKSNPWNLKYDGIKMHPICMYVHDDVCLSSPFSLIYRSQYRWHVSIECVRAHLKQKHYSIDHQTFLRMCMPYTRREAIEMKKNSKCMCVCVGKKLLEGKNWILFLSLDINKIRKISSFFYS